MFVTNKINISSKWEDRKLTTIYKDIDAQIYKKTIKLDKEVVTLFLPNGKKALLTTLKDTDKQLLTLQAILADDTIMREETYNIIDVRFDQPVLKSE